ncbi:restriction endonuclease subunit S, partial [Fervidobacterium gondwanense]
ELTAELTARKKQYEYYRDLLLTFDDDDAVEWKRIEEITNSISSGKNKDKREDGLYPVYGSTGIIGKTDNFVYEKQQILVARVGANAGYVHIADGRYDVSDNTLIIDVKDGYALRYVYYQLCNINLNRLAKGGGQPLITASQLKDIQIPVPPLEEQERIVAILDRFEALCNDLTIGLPAEIEAREKQFKYYLNKLLDFKEATS